MKYLTGCLLLIIASALAQVPPGESNVNHNVITIDHPKP
ncbi:uncharacterized protein LOC113564867 [Drosophila erecta]|nr:uncharacterized protein LOC113564867 [Drosophila erecta]